MAYQLTGTNMLVYILVFLFALVGALYNRRMANNMRIFWLSTVCVYSILIIGLRYRVGLDTMGYMLGYEKHDNLNFFVSNFSFETIRDPLYHLLCAFAKSNKWDFWVIQLIMSAITTSCIYIFLYRTCKNPFIGILLYCILQWLYFSAEIMRESAAVGIFLLNYRNFQRKNYLKYYLFSFLSIGFHFSAAITWIIPWCNRLRVNWIYLLLCSTIIFIAPFVSSLNTILALASIADNVDFFIDQAETLNLNWKIVELVRSAIIPIMVIYLNSKYDIKFEFKGLVLLQLLFCCGTFAIPIMFSRFTNYTGLFVVVALSNIISSVRIKPKLKCCIWSIIVISQSYYYYDMYSRWIPYVSIFNPMQVKERENKWYNQFRN